MTARGPATPAKRAAVDFDLSQYRTYGLWGLAASGPVAFCARRPS
jgi:hypothetical protein